MFSFARLIASLFLVTMALDAFGLTAQGTAFTYQGELRQNNTAVNASVDMVFALFDSASEGSPVGPALSFTAGTANAVQVQNGIFTVALDFGPLAFNTPVSEERYLEVTVNGNVLAPRTKIESAPYALQARTAEFAYSVSNASIGAAQINTSAVQVRVTGSCNPDQKVLAVNANGTVVCDADATGGAGTVVSVDSGAGLTGGPINSSGTLSIANGGVGLAQINTAEVQARISGMCAIGEYVRGINVDGGLVCAPVPAAKRITTVDGNPGVGSYSSLAIGNDGFPVVSYWDSNGSHLKVASCNDAACSAATLHTVDAAAGVGLYTSIAIGAEGFPVISYYDQTNVHLKVAKCTDTACANAALIKTIDLVGTNGLYTSVAVGPDTFPVISYWDYSGTHLKVAKCVDATCAGAANIHTVDASPNVGAASSIAIGSDTFPVISHSDYGGTHLKVAKCIDVACALPAVNTTVDSTPNIAALTSLAIGADTFPVISYTDYGSHHLRVAKCVDAACAGAAVINTVDPATSVYAASSIAIGSDTFPVVTYVDSTKIHVKFAKCNDAACASAVATTADPNNTGGEVTVRIGADMLPVLSYIDSVGGTHLKVAKCNNRFCQ